MSQPIEASKVVGKQFIHSYVYKSKFETAVVVKERIKYEDGTIEPNLKIFDNPRRSFYITQPRYQTYKFKPEYEYASRLDKFTVYEHELRGEIAEKLGLSYNKFDKRYIHNNTLFKSPYIFGGDISIEALIKMDYLNKWTNASIEPTVGFLDIETSIETKQIILISYMHDNIVHTAILKQFLFEEKKGKRTPISKDDLLQHINTNLASRIGDLKIDYDLKVFDKEIHLIAWIFQMIHASKTDFISIWNMNFDIPKIVDAIRNHKYDPAVFFKPPELPEKYKQFSYYEDKRKTSHFTLKWHWVYSPCASQFIDAQGLFSQCRRTLGFRDKYDLNSILEEEIGLGKLPLSEGSHIIMQRHHFKDYIVYNIFDVIGLRLLEDKNRDVLAMCILGGVTPVSKFSTQTLRATNNIYYNRINKGMVMSSCSSEDNFVKLDKLMAARTGGSVLSPSLVRGIGIPLTI